MAPLHAFPRFCVALALLAIVGHSLASEQVELLVVAATVAALSWYVTEGPRGRVLPRRAAGALMLVASAVMVFDLLEHHDQLPLVLGRFTTWLILIKLFERRTARDHGQIMSLSLLLMLIGCAQQPPKLLFGVLLFVYAALGVYVLLLYHLAGGHERMLAARRAADPAGRVPGGRRPVIGQSMVGHLRVLALSIAVGGVVLSLAVFVIFPRSIGRGMLTPFSSFTAGGRSTGYTSEVNLIRGTRITASPREAFTLEVTNEFGMPLRLTTPLLLRGATHSIYRDGLWSSGYTADRSIDTDRNRAPLTPGIDQLLSPRRRTARSRFGPEIQLAPPESARADAQHVEVRQSFRFTRATKTVFALYAPTAVSAKEPMRFSLTNADSSLRAGGFGIRQYDVYSVLRPDADAIAALGAASVAPLAGGMYWELTSRDAIEVRQLAWGLLEDAGLPVVPPAMDRTRWSLEAAAVFDDYLRGGQFQYTLDLTDMRVSNHDPIHQFLFEEARGHCEYFASALTALCHTVGIPARVVSGYSVSEYDESEEHYVGREWNAHAWVEVPVGQGLHVPFDPTPASAIDAITTPPTDIAGRFGWFYGQIEGAWSEQFVEFDSSTQADLFETIEGGGGERLAQWWSSVKAWMESVNRAFNLGQAGYVWLAVVAMIVVTTIIVIVRAFRRLKLVRRTLRLRRHRRRERRRFERQLTFYLDMLVLLRRGGLEKPEWQTPLHWADDLRGARPTVGRLIAEITQLYYDGRFGPGLDDSGTARAQTLLQELRGELAGRVA